MIRKEPARRTDDLSFSFTLAASVRCAPRLGNKREGSKNDENGSLLLNGAGRLGKTMICRLINGSNMEEETRSIMIIMINLRQNYGGRAYSYSDPYTAPVAIVPFAEGLKAAVPLRPFRLPK